jgi:hypothetical protein
MQTARPDAHAEFSAVCRRLDGQVADTAELLRLLVHLLATALSLPEVEPASDEAAADPPDLDESVRRVVGHVASLVGDRDYYWELFDPR